MDIGWDIDITEAAEQAHDSDPEGDPGQAEPSPLQNGLHAQEAAWPESVVKMTQDSGCRTALLDDLHELKSFLLQQVQELTAGRSCSHTCDLCIKNIAFGQQLQADSLVQEQS